MIGVCTMVTLLIPTTKIVYVSGLIVFSFAVSGVKKGQRLYSRARENARATAALMGLDPSRIYWQLTSLSPTVGILVVTAGLVTLGGLNGHLPSALALSCAVCLGRFAAELLGHAASALNDVKVPQYAFLPVAALFSTATIATLHSAPSSTLSLPAPRVLEAVLASLALAIPWSMRRLTTLAHGSNLSASWILPAFRGAQLPLPVRLWTLSDRSTTSLTLGLSVLASVLLWQYANTVLPRLVAYPPYVAPELTIAVFYVASFMLALLYREPLNISSLSGRRPLFGMIHLSIDQEARALWRGVAVPVALTAIPVACFLSAALGRPQGMVGMAAYVLTATGAVWAAFIGGARSSATGSPMSDAPPGAIMMTALPGVFLSLLAVGYQSTRHGSVTGALGWTIAAILVAAAYLIHRISLASIRRTFHEPD